MKKKLLSQGKIKLPLLGKVSVAFVAIALVCVAGASAWYIMRLRQENQQAQARITTLEVGLTDAQRRVDDLENTDFAKKNVELTKELAQTKASLSAQLKQTVDSYTKQLAQIHDDFAKVASLYERIVDLKEGAGKRSPLDKLYASILRTLADQKISDAETALKLLDKQIADAEATAAASSVSRAAANLPVNNNAPGSGYSQQKVHTDAGDFIVSIIAADLNSTKVIVDTASDTNCPNNCPVFPLQTYVQRSGAYAGINGVYFCPESYPTCAGKTNAFDQLIMNKNKVYFNSDNNVYSQNPVAIFGPGASARFLAHAQEWGRDSGVDSVISNNPSILIGGQVLAAPSDPKLSSKGYRGFISHKSNTVYIGFVHNATTNEGAQVLKTMGMEDAVNLDSGGSTALWFGGYKLGPGRNLPMGILFVRR